MRTVKVALVVVSLIVAMPAITMASHSNAELAGEVMSSEKKWPCCNECGFCTRSLPPLCACNDERPGSCHSSCSLCEQTGSTSEDGTPMYRCRDVLPCYCQRSCSASADNKAYTGTTAIKSVIRRLIGDDDWPWYCPRF